MRVDVLLFATLKDITGSSRVRLTLPDDAASVDDIRRALIGLHPALERGIYAAIASVNREFARGDEIVNEGDEVAFFPPVSGGSDSQSAAIWPEIFLLPDAPINHDEIISSITTPATGAVCLFSGMVRGQTQRTGHLPQTQYLEYEAYEAMALAKMRQVAGEIRQQWPKVQGIAVVQRVGRLMVGQNTVLIACSAAHRDDGCFEAARFGIDRLKEIVPVWKKEVGEEGSAWIEGHYTPSEQDRGG